ncbi:MAG TPA: amidohydrolase [Vicinamibacteria bacterium]|nr:amidohydrolase [Vicinamibacteria bacterium]
MNLTNWTGRGGAALALSGLAALAQAQTQKADLVLKNGTVYTLDAQRPKARAVAIAGNLIRAVGTDKEMAALVGPTTRVIDLKGQTVIPGFSDSHVHLLSVGAARLGVDLQGTRNYREVVERVAAAVKGKKAGDWIRGRGWHEGKWTEASVPAVRGFPTHDALSAVSPDNPVVLTRADGHALLVNRKVLELMGITRDTPAPKGGEIIKDSAGRPTGILVDKAKDLVHVPKPTPEEMRRALQIALEDCVRKGITSLADAGADLDTVALYKEAVQAGKLPVRIYVMLSGLETLRHFTKPEINLGEGLLTIRAVKLYADGAMGSRGAALLAPYSDDPGNSGFFTTPPETILEASRYALAHGFQVCTHAIGDRANRMVLDVYEKALKEFPQVKDPRFRIEHAQILDAAEVPRFARLGVIASMQGIHCPSDRPWAESRLGRARVQEELYVWRKLLKAGARIINGTDAPVEDLSAIQNFHASVTRQDSSGNPPGGFDPEQRMTREEALRSYTLDAAYGAFAEETRGSLQAGKHADLVVLSKDIMTVPDGEIMRTEVIYTIVDGKVRLEKTTPAR